MSGRYYVPDCVFCNHDRIASPIFHHVASNGEPVISFEPLGPVVPGHELVVPVRHVNDAGLVPRLTGAVMEVASVIAGRLPAFNIITSAGQAATQTVPHLHVHVVPRRLGDGLALPWTGQHQ